VKRIRTAVLRLLGWSVGIPANIFPQLTFSEAAGMADALGLGSIEGFSAQKVSPVIAKNLDYNLQPDEVMAVRSRLTELRMKMPVYHVDSIGPDEVGRRKVFEFAKGLEVETIVAASTPDSAALDKLANEYGINVAIESAGDPRSVMSMLEGRSLRMGVSADIGAWIEQGIVPVEGLKLLKHRLMVARLRDRSALGLRGVDVILGSGVAGVQDVLMEIARQEPAPLETLGRCGTPNCNRVYGPVKPLFIALDAKIYTGMDQFRTTGSAETFGNLWESAQGFEKAARPAMGYRVDLDSRLVPPTSPDLVPAEQRQRIEAALPRQALVKPQKSRKLLIIDLCPAGDEHHTTIAHANLALTLMAKYTGAYQPIFSNDLNNLKYPKIKQFDAVVLNNTLGELFPDPDVLGGLIRFVREGGGLLGIHAATYASMDLPEFTEMMGAADGPHRTEPGGVKIDDPNSPLTRGFGGKSFIFTDEFYHFMPTQPYSRDKLHILLSIDNEKSDMSRFDVRPDHDYGLCWIRSYGKGRVFNSAMGHTPEFFETPALAEMILGGIQFVLGDLAVNTTPSAELAARKK
jgi:type 1 glutamine amidotransferase